VSAIAVLQLFALAGLLLAVASGLLVSALIPAALRQVASWSPERRHGALFLIALAPALLGVVSLFAVSLPPLLTLMWPDVDHCLHHGEGHGHLCFVHLPHHLGGVASWLLLTLGAAWVLDRGIRGSASLLRAQRVVRGLLAMGSKDASKGALIVPTSTPVCLSVGLWRPVVVLSKAVTEALTPGQLSVVLRHEAAHAKRRDTLCRLIARVTTLFMLPGARSRLLGTLELSAEQTCDEVASTSAGRLSVAETILRMERILAVSSSSLQPLATPFGENAIEARVASLLTEPAHGGRTDIVPSVLALAAAALLLASFEVHHITETLLGLLTH
jgi:Zn-dependent protease with chaperone function